MARPRPTDTLPTPSEITLRTSDEVAYLFRRNPGAPPEKGLVFPDKWSEMSKVFRPKQGREKVYRTYFISDLILLAVWRRGVLIAEVQRPRGTPSYDTLFPSARAVEQKTLAEQRMVFQPPIKPTPAAVQRAMEQRNPFTDPLPGDVVEGYVRRTLVKRVVKVVNYAFVQYTDGARVTGIDMQRGSWKEWGQKPGTRVLKMAAL